MRTLLLILLVINFSNTALSQIDSLKLKMENIEKLDELERDIKGKWKCEYIIDLEEASNPDTIVDFKAYNEGILFNFYKYAITLKIRPVRMLYKFKYSDERDPLIKVLSASYYLDLYTNEPKLFYGICDDNSDFIRAYVYAHDKKHLVLKDLNQEIYYYFK